MRNVTDRTDEEFWFPIVKPDGEWDHDQIMRELHDYRTLLHEVPLVYDHVTGGRISKPNTAAEAVIGEAGEFIQRCCDEAVADDREEWEETDHVTAAAHMADVIHSLQQEVSTLRESRDEAFRLNTFHVEKCAGLTSERDMLALFRDQWYADDLPQLQKLALWLDPDPSLPLPSVESLVHGAIEREAKALDALRTANERIRDLTTEQG